MLTQHGTKARNICSRHIRFHFNYPEIDYLYTKILAQYTTLPFCGASRGRNLSCPSCTWRVSKSSGPTLLKLAGAGDK